MNTQDSMGSDYTLFLLEDREGKPVAVLLPTEAVAAQEQVLPQVCALGLRAVFYTLKEQASPSGRPTP